MRFSIFIRDSTKGLDRAQLLSEIQNDMKDLYIPEKKYYLCNLFVLYQDILRHLFNSQILTMWSSYAVLTVIFLIMFRSLLISIICIAPNILATLAVLGVMGWLKIPLDLMTITISSIVMGIAVDDAIHYVHRYMEEVKTCTPEEAIWRTHLSVGYAMNYTAFIIIMGFSLLAFSDFVPSIMFGLLTSLALALSLISALCLLPGLLIKFVGRNEHPFSMIKNKILLSAISDDVKRYLKKFYLLIRK